MIREAKNKEIEELRKLFDKEEKLRRNRRPKELNIDEIEKSNGRRQPIQFNTKYKETELLATTMRSMKASVVASRHSSFKSKVS
jgi:hypothetical protein